MKLIRLEILDINDNEYTLKDVESNKTYQLSIVFFGLSTLPQIGDIAVFHSELLDPNYHEYSTSYYFGPLDEVYGRQIKSESDLDLIALQIDENQIFLKRFFG